MQYRKSVVLPLVGAMLLSTSIVAVTQMRMWPTERASQSASFQIVEVSPSNRISPRQQVIYDFNRQTVTVVTIYVEDSERGTTVDVESIKSLTQVTAKQRK